MVDKKIDKITCKYPDGTYIISQANKSLLELTINDNFYGYVCISEIYDLITKKHNKHK